MYQFNRASVKNGESDKILSCSSPLRIGGLLSTLTALLRGSMMIVNTGDITTESFIDIVNRYRVNISICDIYHTTNFLNYFDKNEVNLPSLQRYISVGSKIPLKSMMKMEKHFSNSVFIQSYGMTETVGCVSSNKKHPDNDSVGHLTIGCEAKIIDEAGNRLSVGECGELYVKTPYLFSGYLGEEAKTRSMFDSEGFLKTGDIAYFNENCELFVADRKMDIFVSQGHLVPPSELENIINRIDGVAQSCVVPISFSDVDNLPAAVVVKMADSKITTSDVFNVIEG